MKKLLSFAVSTLILAVLYSLLDTKALLDSLRSAAPRELALSLVLLAGLIGLSILRLRLLAGAAGLPVSMRKAGAATLAANALNLVLPGKIGDIAKASMLRENRALLPAVNLTLYEKGADVFAVFAWGAVALVGLASAQYYLSTFFVATTAICIFLLLVSRWPARLLLGANRVVRGPGFLERLCREWDVMLERLSSRRLTTLAVIMLSLAIWAGHFLQIGLMSWALGVKGPWLPLVGTLPLVILAGLAPFTLGGVGTRDAAIILLVGPLIGTEKAAALGVLFWLRYLLPGLAGLPFLPHYFRSIYREPASQTRTQ